MQDSETTINRQPYSLIPALIVVIVIGGLLLLAWISFFSISFSAPRGYLKTRQEWPEPFAEIFNADEIEIYGLPQFLDNRVVAQVTGHLDLIERIVQVNSLESTDELHPLVPTLHQSLPRDWPGWKDSEDDQWYATKNFGSEHLEGQDLFLLVTNANTGRSLIYYNWIF